MCAKRLDVTFVWAVFAVTMAFLWGEASAHAGDSWSNPHPGIRRLHRTNSDPNNINVLEVDLCAAGVGVRSTKPDERQRTPSSFARLVGAQAAVNGDFFSFSSYSTTGLAIGEGQKWSGTADNTASGFAAFGNDRVEWSGMNESRAAEDWMRQVTSGLGLLVEDGQAITSAPSRPSHCSQRHPRTAMGLSRDRRTLYLAVVDGRRTDSRGMNCVELAALMKDVGAWNAVNLDGGGSSAMWVEGSGVLNHPSDGSERVVANHLAVFAGGAGMPTTCDRSYDEAVLQSAARGESTTTDVDGDGVADACSLGPDGVECWLAAGGFAQKFTGPALLQDDGWSDPANYSTLRYGDLDGDGKADLCARYNAGVRCWLSDGAGFGSRFDGPELSDDVGWGSSPSYYSTLAMADVDGDGDDDLCARAAAGVYCYVSSGGGFDGRTPALEALSNDAGFKEMQYFGTIRYGDVDGDGRDDVCARTPDGMRCWLFDGSAFTTEIRGPQWSDAGGWNKLPYWPTIRLRDVDGDGRADLCARGASGFRCHLSEGDGFGGAIGGDLWPNSSGWDDHDNFSTIRLADIDGDGDLDVCARANARMVCNTFEGDSFGSAVTGPEWSNDGDWDNIIYYATIRAADVDGDGLADLCARGYSRFDCATSPVDGDGADLQGPAWGTADGWSSPAFYSTIQLVDPPAMPDEPGDDVGVADAGGDAGTTSDTGGSKDVGVGGDAGGVQADAGWVDGGDAGPGSSSSAVTSSGCACSQTQVPAPGVGLWVLVGLGFVVRRRRL